MDNSTKILNAKAILRGAICGDIIGSAYEWHSTKIYNFTLNTKASRFTDDTVCSIAFMVSNDYESAVRRGVALGGDADTQAAIAGSIAAAYYGEIPKSLLSVCMEKLTEEMKSIINEFDSLLEVKHGNQKILL